jgi:ATP-dependent Clp protease ATP-binding subunit ClpB
LDDGRLTDNKGRVVNFKNTIIIMTSNLGSQLIQENLSHMTSRNSAKIMEDIREELLDLLKSTIQPEFLNRIDDTIIFTPLTREDIRQIVIIQFEQIASRVKRQSFELKITDAAIDWLSSVGYDPNFGARPVKRILQKHVLNELSKKILSGEVEQDKPVWVDVKDEDLFFRN